MWPRLQYPLHPPSFPRSGSCGERKRGTGGRFSDLIGSHGHHVGSQTPNSAEEQPEWPGGDVAPPIPRTHPLPPISPLVPLTPGVCPPPLLLPRTLSLLVSPCAPFPDQSVVLRLGDEAGGCHPIPREISPLCGSLLPDLYPQELGE